MRKIFAIIMALCTLYPNMMKGQGEPEVVLTPYVFSNPKTPQANKALEDKLKRIVTKYGMYSANGSMETPFILTANALEIRQETTVTVPAHTAVELSITFYVGNGEDGTLFSNCNMELKGVGNTLDQAYASAFKKINVNEPELGYTIEVGKKKIKEYYNQYAPALIKKAEGLVASGKYDEAYSILLQIPSICPQYAQAQQLIVKYVQKESEVKNSDIIHQARAAWSADPTEDGASEAAAILSGMTNASPKMQAEATDLMKEISTRLQKAQDQELKAELQMEANEHAKEMQIIKGATKVAVAQASRPVYRVWWW